MRASLRSFKGSVDRGTTTMVYGILMVQTLMASATHIVAKAVVGVIDPMSLTLTRSVISALAMVGMLFLRGRWTPIARGDYRLIFWLSLLAIPVNQFCFLFGMRYTVPSNAALLYAATPILVLLISRVLLGERLSGRKIGGVVLALIGVVIVIFERGFTASMHYVYGNMIIVIAVMAWGLYTVLGKKLIVTYGAIQASAMTIIMGTILFIPAGIVPTLHFPFEILTMSNWLEILYLGIVTSVFAYYLWYYALSRIEVGKVAIFTNLQPVMTALLAVILLGQTITIPFIVGGLIAMCGVVIVQFG
jgi:drug/metabolite transporter (DMT)-like permease